MMAHAACGLHNVIRRGTWGCVVTRVTTFCFPNGTSGDDDHNLIAWIDNIRITLLRTIFSHLQKVFVHQKLVKVGVTSKGLKGLKQALSNQNTFWQHWSQNIWFRSVLTEWVGGEVISQSRQVQDVFEQPPASSSKPDYFYLLFDSVVHMFDLRLNWGCVNNFLPSDSIRYYGQLNAKESLDVFVFHISV